MTFADVLIEAMAARDVGQTQLARLTSLDRKSIWKYLNCGTLPQRRAAQALAAALDWPDLLAAAKVPADRPLLAYGNVAAQLVVDYQKAIADFCAACEPGDLICRNDKCELRPVSPLPFIPLTRRRVA